MKILSALGSVEYLGIPFSQLSVNNFPEFSKNDFLTDSPSKNRARSIINGSNNDLAHTVTLDNSFLRASTLFTTFAVDAQQIRFESQI